MYFRLNRARRQARRLFVRRAVSLPTTGVPHQTLPHSSLKKSSRGATIASRQKRASNESLKQGPASTSKIDRRPDVSRPIVPSRPFPCYGPAHVRSPRPAFGILITHDQRRSRRCLSWDEQAKGRNFQAAIAAAAAGATAAAAAAAATSFATGGSSRKAFEESTSGTPASPWGDWVQGGAALQNTGSCTSATWITPRYAGGQKIVRRFEKRSSILVWVQGASTLPAPYIHTLRTLGQKSHYNVKKIFPRKATKEDQVSLLLFGCATHVCVL